jgi:hypothetical protein
VRNVAESDQPGIASGPSGRSRPSRSPRFRVATPALAKRGRGGLADRSSASATVLGIGDQQASRRQRLARLSGEEFDYEIARAHGTSVTCFIGRIGPVAPEARCACARRGGPDSRGDGRSPRRGRAAHPRRPRPAPRPGGDRGRSHQPSSVCSLEPMSATTESVCRRPCDRSSLAVPVWNSPETALVRLTRFLTHKESVATNDHLTTSWTEATL